MTFEAWIVLIVFVFLVVAFLTEAMRPGLILLSAAVIFMATGIITDRELIAGFSNDGLVTIAVLFLVNEGIRQSGLMALLARRYLPHKRNPMAFMLPRIMIPVAFFSAFLNNLPIVVNFAPILIRWSEIMKLSYKKFLIPLSYAAILGGMCTLIGTSSNLVVHGLMLDSGNQGFHLFELGKIGLFVAFFGFVYMAVFGNWLLPGEKIKFAGKPSEGKDYNYNLQLVENSQLIGKQVVNNKIEGLTGLYVNSVARNNKILTPGKHGIRLQPDDDILVTGSSDRLNYILFHKEIKLKGMEYLGHVKPENLKQYEVVLSPRFPWLGQTVTQFSFFEQFHAVVLAIHRNGERITDNLNNLRLKVGDNVVLLATENFYQTWGSSQMFYLVNYLRDLHHDKGPRVKWMALIILLAMVIAIVVNEIVSYGFGMRLNIFFYVAFAALLLIWLKILPQQNYTKSVSWDLIISIASAFAISKAIQNSGVANMLAEDTINVVRSIGPVGVLAIIWLITSVLTEIITNNAAVALVFPVAAVAAQLLGVDARPFFVAIAIAGASSFMTARGYRANLVIKAIGKYSAADFLRIGAPMQIIAFILSVLLIPLFWPF
ncbi:Di-and tricarboxylate transporter [Mariniphaga anaerophila]|uniref:Di-and tricarboxylate transporter n=1 Tax=Mariniphaga anaerophila TaxID=1484053 RepID=A0A1M4VM37_9BACT|nr:SLC13 family permease [Mariniphaga anaerophila]SHE70131.1 Di-and tricarboxylate transporter [Mariniphaga anaerophila]